MHVAAEPQQQRKTLLQQRGQVKKIPPRTWREWVRSSGARWGYVHLRICASLLATHLRHEILYHHCGRHEELLSPHSLLCRNQALWRFVTDYQTLSEPAILCTLSGREPIFTTGSCPAHT